MRTIQKISVALFFFASSLAWASATTSKQIDIIQNSTGGNALSVPSSGSALISNGFVQDAFLTCNDSNTAFSLSFTPSSAASMVAYLDGAALVSGASYDYTLSGSTLTLNTACSSGQTLLVVYPH